jgi:hypothetical protein
MSQEIIIKKGFSKKELPKSVAMMPPITMKCPIFTPVNKSFLKKNEDNEFLTRKINLENFYSYNIQISGPFLNMSQDFKIWAWLLKIRDQRKSNNIEISATDFAEILGYKKRSVNRNVKLAIDNSLSRLMRQHISWTNNGETKLHRANLLNYAELDIEGFDNNIKVEFNSKLYTLYSDKFIYYMDLAFYDDIKGEVAKALWSFYESNQGFKTFNKTNLKKRLMLNSSEKEQNRQIKEAHKNLIDAGYLNSFTIEGKGEKIRYQIERIKNFNNKSSDNEFEKEVFG